MSRPPLHGLRSQVLAAVEASGDGLTYAALAQALKMDPKDNRLHCEVYRLHTSGRIRKVMRGYDQTIYCPLSVKVELPLEHALRQWKPTPVDLPADGE